MNGSYGQYGRWNGSGRSYGYSPAATAVLNQQGTTITGPSDGGVDTLSAVGAGGQVVSGLSARGAVSQKKGERALAASGKTVAGAASIVGTAAALGAPLNAVPIAGQIAFAAVVVGAATFAFIKAMRKGRITNKAADALAAKYGIDSDMKKWVRKIMRMKKVKRLTELAKQRKRYSKKKKGGLHALGRSKKRLKEKIDVLRQVIEFDKAEAKAKAKAKATGASAAAIAADSTPDGEGALASVGTALESIGIAPQYRLPLGLGLGALVLFLIFRSTRGGS